MNTKIPVAIMVSVIVFCLWLGSFSYNANKQDATNWITNNGEEIVKIELKGWTDIGPYWYAKNSQYFRIETLTNVYWFKYGWSRHIQKELADGDYEIIED